MKQGCQKYKPFNPVELSNRTWPNRTISSPPVWCSVDLRDGNQALTEPMDFEEKLDFFKMLVRIGFKEIEVGFPSASETEFRILRELIEGGYIPSDVTIQVLVQAREHLIRKTFDAIRGAKKVIFHLYNTTAPLQRRLVFGCDGDGVISIVSEAAALIRKLGDEAKQAGMELRYEYSPENFSETEPDFAIGICEKLLDTLGATAQEPVILNLPTTVENCMPNQFADLLEYFSAGLRSRDRVILSVHPHNDRGTGVAAAEMALLAGAQRIEGTLFGNGERTGNVDIMTLAMNLYSQGIDPGLDFSDLSGIRRLYERCTHLPVHDRHPYAGALAFTAFSGSHQDAINKGLLYMRDSGSEYWQVPYLPIDPADVGRKYEPIIRINSQSGKSGAAFVMERSFGYHIPKTMQPELGAIVQEETDRVGSELPPQRIFELFKEEFVDITFPYKLLQHSFQETQDDGGHSHVHFSGTLCHKETLFTVDGDGNGPIDAFFNAIHGQKMDRFTFVDYSEHAISDGSDSRAVAYIHLRARDGRDVFGVGISHNINLAPLRGIISAVNRAQKLQAREAESPSKGN